MYVMNEATIDLPSAWKDQSINVMSSGAPMEQGLTLTVTRDDIPFGMSFDEYLEDQIGQVEKSMNDFALLGRRQVVLDGMTATELECRWQAKQGQMHQLIYMAPTPSGRAIVLTVSAPGRLTETQKGEMKRVMATLRFRRG